MFVEKAAGGFAVAVGEGEGGVEDEVCKGGLGWWDGLGWGWGGGAYRGGGGGSRRRRRGGRGIHWGRWRGGCARGTRMLLLRSC